jgi:elongation factor P
MKINGSAIRAGNVIEVDGKIWRVIKHNIVSPGKGGAFNQIEIRDAKTGTKSNMKFRSDETVEQLRVEEKKLQYLFADGNQLTFMDQESYEQVTVDRELIGDPADFLTDGMIVSMQFIETQVVGVELPTNAIGTIV